MPCCIGAIDGSHVPIKAPSIDEHQYVNRHGQHSINTMMVSGPTCMFYYLSAKRPGSVNDQRVLRLSSLAARFGNGWRPLPEAVILGDSGYKLSTWLMIPILSDNLRDAEERYNQRHKRTRRVVECAFGILKKRFACLEKLRLSPEFAADVIKACAILHNIALIHEPLTQDEIDETMNEIENRQNNIEIVQVRNDGATDPLALQRQSELVAFFERAPP